PRGRRPALRGSARPGSGSARAVCSVLLVPSWVLSDVPPRDSGPPGPSAGAAVAVLVGAVHRGPQCYWRTPRWIDHALPVPCAARTAHIGAACTAHARRIRSTSIVELAIRL